MDPCQPPPEKPPGPEAYGRVIADRLCIASPQSANLCDNDCGKICRPQKPLSVGPFSTPSPAACSICYDCEVDEIWYAVFATWLAFSMCQWVYFRTRLTTYAMHAVGHKEEEGYSQLDGVGRMGKHASKVQPHYFRPAVAAFGVMSLIFTIISYMIVNYANFVIVVIIMKKEMCVKLWDFQTNYQTPTENTLHWALFSNLDWDPLADDVYKCWNDACPRIAGLIIATWLSLWALYTYWRLYQVVQEISDEKMEIYEYETQTRATGHFGKKHGFVKDNLFCSVQ